MEFIPISQPSLGELERRYLIDAFDSGWISSIGHYIEELEKSFAVYCGTEHAVAVSNGTVAIHLALEALGIEEGDEVIVPDLTFVATANAVRHANGVPVIVDVDRETMCMDPAALARAITPKTRAVIPVHLYGHPADMDRIMRIATARGIAVVEDAAEAHGAAIGGKRVGSFGRCGTFSFFGNKIMTTGEGGMITTDDGELAGRLRFLRDHGMSRERKYWHTEIGYNYRMTNLQAAIGVAQLQRIDSLIEQKRSVIERYRKNFSGMRRVTLNPCKPGFKNTYWMLCLSFDGWNEQSRSVSMAGLKERKIDTRPFFYPLTDMPMYRSPIHETPVTHDLSYRGINLPSFVGISNEQIDYICENVIGLLELSRS
ncbi:MAG: DegT/DnrJ/EryC1/StrS family aminotransferase [Spirochaetia bacterium]|jgi:perosamine synthetase